jgi:hypothetical protein
MNLGELKPRFYERKRSHVQAPNGLITEIDRFRLAKSHAILKTASSTPSTAAKVMEKVLSASP